MIPSRPRLVALALSGVLAAGAPVTLAAAQPAGPAPLPDAGATPPVAQAPAVGDTGGPRHGARHHGTAHHGATGPHAARSSHMHGTVSPHVTPKRQHMMEQQMRGARGGADRESVEIDRLNSMSLQRAQGGAEASPAGTGPAAPR